jgi:ribA/ribD-fused uncharacterized protein
LQRDERGKCVSAELIEKVQCHDENNIKGFFGEYRWLSNFHVCTIYNSTRSRAYTSTEAAYMAEKSLDPAIRDKFENMTPKEARKFGQQIELRPDWEKIKLKVMYHVNVEKYTNPVNQDLRQKLIDTGDKHLEETNWWRDKFWGTHFGEGKNNLGKILMYIREGIQRGYI